MKNQILTFLVGLPASGKSTIAKDLAARNGSTVIISWDSIREAMFNRYDFPRDSMIREVSYYMFDIAVKNKQSIVIDNTNLKKAAREIFYNRLPADHNYVVEKIIVHPGILESIRRNNLRDRGNMTVSDSVIWNMARSCEIDSIRQEYFRLKNSGLVPE